MANYLHWGDWKKDMLDIVESFKNELNIEHKGMYDWAVMFSGGKDSTFLLYLLKEVYKKSISNYYW